MSKTIIVIDTARLDKKVEYNVEDPGNLIRGMADREAYRLPNGKWKIRKAVGAQNNGGKPEINYLEEVTEYDYIQVVIELAKDLGIDLQDPEAPGPQCTCPTECDCQDYEGGLVSNECPIHNDEPQPSIECPQHGLISLHVWGSPRGGRLEIRNP